MKTGNKIVVDKDRVLLAVKADKDWIEFALSQDIFMTNYCGYWMRGMEYTKKLGWLCFEHGGEVKAPKKTPIEILRRWKSGDKLPKGWHRLDSAAAMLAFAHGVLAWGAEWYGANNTDCYSYDHVIQMALLGEERYG